MLTPIRLTGSSLAVREIDDETTRIAPLDVRVLITGESGVGKQTIARLIHERSPRANRPFVTIDCGAVADATFESEWLAPLTAAGGTLFLRGAEEMSVHKQWALHRHLESMYEAYGAVRPRLRVLAGQVRFESIAVKRAVLGLPADGPVIGTPRPRSVARPRTTP